MKKFLFKTALFFVLVAIIDILCGWSFDWLRNKARGGQTLKNQYISEQCEDDILILGSSKAAHHYIPQIISDSLSFSCYNCGQEGNGIVAAYARYKMITTRKKPQLVIYEITPSYDYLKDNGYSSYLGVIRQYTNYAEVRREYLDFSDNLECFRLLSNMYCNNSRIISNVKDIIKATPYNLGYEPLYGIITPTQKTEVGTTSNDAYSIDSLKYSYMERLIKATKEDGTQLLFVISPTYTTSGKTAIYKPAIELSEKYNIPLINNINHVPIAGNSELFQDKTHLNNKGAVVYSKIVACQLKQFLE